MDPEKEIARFFTCCETPGQRKMNTRMSRRARRELVQGVVAGGIEGKSILEIGCGPGDLIRELLNRGAGKGLGIDLTEDVIDVARRRSVEEGLEHRTEFRVGNGAKDELGSHDVVVLDKVICCYPDWRLLVENTSSSAGALYGFVLPRSDGFSGMMARGFVGVGNFFLRLRKCGFNAFVHDFGQIDEFVSSRGFRRTHLHKGPVWQAVVYARA